MSQTTSQETGAKHTPGPWATDIVAAGGIIDNEGVNSGRKGDSRIDGATVYVDHGSGKGGQICSLPHDPDDGLDIHDEEYIANARLIAAAPDLLAALKAIADYSTPLPAGLLEQARAAIARATGERG